MAVKTVTNLPVVVGRYDADFINTADAFLNALPTFCTQLNSSINEINATEAGILDTKNKIDTTYEDIKVKKTDIDNKYEEIQQYVIPEEATYSEETIEEKLRMNQILVLTNSI